MRFRISDKRAGGKFQRSGVTLRTATLRVEDRGLHFTVAGEEGLPTLYFIHGSPGSWDAFSAYMQDSSLLRICRMVGVDRPGFGYSDFGRPLPLAGQIPLLKALLDSLDNGLPIFLAGHSLGGPIAVKLAATHPGRIRGILLLSASLDPSLEPAEKWRRFMAGPPFRYLLPGAFRPSNTELLWFKQEVYSLEADLRRVEADVYLSHGMRDRWVPPGNVAYARDRLHSAGTVETRWIEEGGHLIPWTHRDRIARVMREMLLSAAPGKPHSPFR